MHSGQVCSAGARLLVEESIAEAFVSELVWRASGITLGGPFDPDAETGPLISAAHRDRVTAYVDAGISEGARLRCGGAWPTGELSSGFFYLPTVLDRVSQGMSVVTEEALGPVVTVETFSSEAEAIDRANDTIYGLAGAVWTGDPARAERVARALRAGTVWVNDFHPYLPQAEWGGFKQSGFGRELGPSGFTEYQEVKHIYQNLSPVVTDWFAAPGPASPQRNQL